MPRGLSRRSQFLLWLLQHQPEVIEVVIEYETDADADDVLDLEEDHELAEKLTNELLADHDVEAELEAKRDYLQALWDRSPDSTEAD